MTSVYRTTSAVNESGIATFFATGLAINTSYTPTFGGVAGAGVVAIGDIDASSKSGSALKSVKSDGKGVAIFSIKLAQDATTEGTENFSITVDGATSGVIKVYDSSTTAAKAVIPSVLSVNEGGSVNYSISAPDGTYTYAFTGSTATVTSDYTITSSTTVNTTNSTVVVKNGVATLSVKTIEDNTVEGPETLALSLTGPASGGVSTTFTAATVTVNDTSSGIPSLIAATSVNEGGSAVFTLSNIAAGNYPYTLSGAVGTAPTATVLNEARADIGTPTVNTSNATIGSIVPPDGTSATGTITVLPGKTSVALTVPVNSDHVLENPPEVLKLVLGAPTIIISGSTHNTALETAVTGLESNVLINDSSVAYTYKLSPSASTVNEGNSVVFSISDGKPGATVGYTVGTTGLPVATSTMGHAVLGDFATTIVGTTAASAFPTGTVTLDGSGKGTFTIFTYLDHAKDGGTTARNEKFSVVLNDNESSPTDITVVGTNIITITDSSIA